jgi:uncharacterized coiled-coil protein SlyX
VWEHHLLPAVLAELSKMLRGYHPGFDGATRIAEIDARTMKIDKDIRVLESRFAVPEASVEAIQARIAELRQARHQTLQERVVLDEQQERLQSVQNALDHFEHFFGLLGRKSQLEEMQRFLKRIDLGVSDIVIHWWFSDEVSRLPRTEVSPKRGKKGVRGRVVEIGALNWSGDLVHGLATVADSLEIARPHESEVRPTLCAVPFESAQVLGYLTARVDRLVAMSPSAGPTLRSG